MMNSEIQRAPIISPAKTINRQVSEYLTKLTQGCPYNLAAALTETAKNEWDTVCFFLNQKTLTDEHRLALRLRAKGLMAATGNAPLSFEEHQ